MQANETDRQNWSSLQSDLESKLAQAYSQNTNLESELANVRYNHEETNRNLRSQIDQISSKASSGGEWKIRFESLDKEHQDLKMQLLQQEKVTSEVKEEAAGWLDQMKALSERNGSTYEREERLIHQNHSLEKELQVWKTRYARSKAQLRTLRTSSTADTLKVPDTGVVATTFVAQDGLVRDIHVTKFQIAIDDLLQSARRSEPNSVLRHVKSVIIAVRNISLDIGDTQPVNDEMRQKTDKQKAKLSSTSNNLITAARNFAAAKGLSPVSLLDAAASHVTAAVIELIHSTKIRSTPSEELIDDDDNSFIADSPADYYGISHSRASAGGDSVYSLMSSPRRSQAPSNLSKTSKTLSNGVTNGVSNGTSHPSGLKPTHSVHKPTDNRIHDLKVNA